MAQWKPRAKFTDPTKLTRKVFDKYCDRMELKLQRVKEDYRADLQALFHRITNLEAQLTLYFPIEEDVIEKGDLIQLPDGRWRRRDSEELV